MAKENARQTRKPKVALALDVVTTATPPKETTAPGIFFPDRRRDMCALQLIIARNQHNVSCCSYLVFAKRLNLDHDQRQ